jgi:hypothetical protein
MSANRVVFPRASYTISVGARPAVTVFAPGVAPMTVEEVSLSAQS